MSDLSISKAWDETKTIIAQDGKLMMTVAAALMLLPQVIAGVVTGQMPAVEGQASASGLATLIASIISIIGQLAIVWLAIGAKVSVGESIRHGLGRTPSMIGAMLLLVLFFVLVAILVATILTFAGVIAVESPPRPRDAVTLILLLGLPALAITVRLLPSIAVASAEAVGPIAIIRRSWSLTAGHFWKIFGFVVVLLIAVLVVAAAVGAVSGLLVRAVLGEAEPFTMAALAISLIMGILQMAFIVIYTVMIARIYLQLAGGRPAEVSVPHSGG